jgi:hypothetical protein
VGGRARAPNTSRSLRANHSLSLARRTSRGGGAATRTGLPDLAAMSLARTQAAPLPMYGTTLRRPAFRASPASAPSAAGSLAQRSAIDDGPGVDGRAGVRIRGCPRRSTSRAYASNAGLRFRPSATASPSPASRSARYSSAHSPRESRKGMPGASPRKRLGPAILPAPAPKGSVEPSAGSWARSRSASLASSLRRISSMTMGRTGAKAIRGLSAPTLATGDGNSRKPQGPHQVAARPEP